MEKDNGLKGLSRSKSVGSGFKVDKATKENNLKESSNQLHSRADGEVREMDEDEPGDPIEVSDHPTTVIRGEAIDVIMHMSHGLSLSS
ncbi:hypothetical protein V6N13_056254 [Hibiscus sabdariffa]